jgi:hypothetical protein
MVGPITSAWIGAATPGPYWSLAISNDPRDPWSRACLRSGLSVNETLHRLQSGRRWTPSRHTWMPLETESVTRTEVLILLRLAGIAAHQLQSRGGGRAYIR